MAEDLQSALESVRQRAGGPGAVTYLSQVGNWLKAAGTQLPESLGRILAAQPQFCRVEDGRVTFLDGPIVGIDFNAKPDPEESWWIRPDLWTAFLKFRTDLAHFLDMETLQIVQVPTINGEPSGAVAQTPLRYIRIPTIPGDAQKQMARELLGPTVNSAELEEMLARADWTHQLAERVPEPHYLVFEKQRRKVVLEAVRNFLAAHSISETLFLRRSTPRPKHRATDSGRAPWVPDEGLRAFAHSCIDAMTDAELAALGIPLAVLLRVRSQSK